MVGGEAHIRNGCVHPSWGMLYVHSAHIRSIVTTMPEPPTVDPIQTETLYAVIGAIAEGPDLARVLPAIVDLLVDATSCHACFIYLREGDLLRIRAASPVFAKTINRVTLRMDEGLTGWVARHRRPAFIREDALNDPRVKYIPELEEERFQSMVAVPLVDRHGDVIGVVVLHTEAPREFSETTLELLVHVASLVVGAIDNARLYEETRRQVRALRALSELSQELASLTGSQELYEAGCRGIARLLGAEACSLALYDEHGAALLVASVPKHESDVDEQLLHAEAGGRLTAHLMDTGRAFGQIRVARANTFSRDDVTLLETAANHLSLALRTAELIQHLAAENLVRRVFEALEQGNSCAAIAQARAAAWDPSQLHVAVEACPVGDQPKWDDALAARLERRIRLIAVAALVDPGQHGLRALVPLVATDDPIALTALEQRLASIGAEFGVGFGISRPRSSLEDGVAVLSEAADSARIGIALSGDGGAWTYSQLGAYRFLARLVDASAPDQSHADALARLAEYDLRRRASLVDTLEAYLAARGGIRAAAETLMIHTNTLRQRLDRIELLSGLNLSEQDPLSLELSIKVFRLNQLQDQRARDRLSTRI